MFELRRCWGELRYVSREDLRAGFLITVRSMFWCGSLSLVFDSVRTRPLAGIVVDVTWWLARFSGLQDN